MKSALLLGGLDRGTIHTALDANNYDIRTKILKSSVKNWNSICEILEDDKNNEILVLGKLTEYVLFLCCNPYYIDIRERLFNLISKKQHILFVYNENLFGNLSSAIDRFEHMPEPYLKNESLRDKYKEIYFPKELENWISRRGLTIDVNEYEKSINEFIDQLSSSNFNIVPYRTLTDIEIAGQSFIERHDQGLLLRIYVPMRKLWSNEIDKFLALFRDYSSNVVGQDLTLTQNRTDKGITFSLYSTSKTIDSSELQLLFDDFTSFLDICAKDPSRALSLLSQSNLPKERLNEVLSKYLKESKRLLLDLNQEREAKLLSIKHRLESELVDLDFEEMLPNIIPIPNEPSAVLYEGNKDIVENSKTVININPKIVNNVNNIVNSEISGDINYTPEDKQLLKLMDQFASDKAELAQLKSSLNELKDDALSKTDKTTAWQHLQGFLSKSGSKIGDVGVHLLKKYLEQQIL